MICLSNVTLLPETFESAKTVSTGSTAKMGSKMGKPNGHGDRVSKPGSRAVSSVCTYLNYFLVEYKMDIDCFVLCGKRVVSTKGSRPESILSVQDITLQTQALLNVKDSNKVLFMQQI